MGLKGRPETSVRNYHSALCTIPKELSSHLPGGAEIEKKYQAKIFFDCDVFFFFRI